MTVLVIFADYMSSLSYPVNPVSADVGILNLNVSDKLKDGEQWLKLAQP